MLEKLAIQVKAYGGDVAALLGELSDLSRDMTVLKAAPEGGAALLSGVYDRKTLTEQSVTAAMIPRLWDE